jgi:hypothetical protein
MKVTVRGELHFCEDCGSSHMGPRCGQSYVLRLRSIRLDPSATPSKELKRYWDQQAIDDQFGEEATEKTLELTNGVGFNNPEQRPSLDRMFE